MVLAQPVWVQAERVVVQNLPASDQPAVAVQRMTVPVLPGVPAVVPLVVRLLLGREVLEQVGRVLRVVILFPRLLRLSVAVVVVPAKRVLTLWGASPVTAVTA